MGTSPKWREILSKREKKIKKNLLYSGEIYPIELKISPILDSFPSRLSAKF